MSHESNKINQHLGVFNVAAPILVISFYVGHVANHFRIGTGRMSNLRRVKSLESFSQGLHSYTYILVARVPLSEQRALNNQKAKDHAPGQKVSFSNLLTCMLYFSMSLFPMWKHREMNRIWIPPQCSLIGLPQCPLSEIFNSCFVYGQSFWSARCVATECVFRAR